MGKASRTKRDRRTPGTPPPPPPKPKRDLPVFWIVIGALIVAGLVALIVTAPDDDETNEAVKAVENVPVYADVEVEGDSLPDFGGGDDDAEGQTVPAFTAENMDGERNTISPEDGTPRAYVFLAHWCSHCQNEVEALVEWDQDNDVPEGVEVLGISTAASEGQPKFPPAEWLAEERWPWPTYIDDEADTLAEAFGMSGTPFLVFVDADGEVVERHSGEMPVDEFQKRLEAIAEDGE